MTMTWPSLPASRVPEASLDARDGRGVRREGGQGVVGLEPGADDLAQVGRDGIEPVNPVGGEGERDPFLGQDRGRGQLFLPLRLAMGRARGADRRARRRPSCGTPARWGPSGSSGTVSRRTTGTLYALSRSTTLAASRPPTITAVVPNSSARSSARWISSREFASHQTGSFLARAAWRALRAGSNGGCVPPCFCDEGVELLEMVGVEHGLAEVGDRAHQDARIGVLDGPGLLAARGDGPGRASGPAAGVSVRGRGPRAGSNWAARG